MHVDYWHDDQGVDVKGNNMPDEIWVEMKNIKGNHGWLFGEATTIAFDMPELTGFVIVDREELAEYCRDNVDFSGLVRKQEAYKRCYRHQQSAANDSDRFFTREGGATASPLCVKRTLRTFVGMTFILVFLFVLGGMAISV